MRFAALLIMALTPSVASAAWPDVPLPPYLWDPGQQISYPPSELPADPYPFCDDCNTGTVIWSEVYNGAVARWLDTNGDGKIDCLCTLNPDTDPDPDPGNGDPNGSGLPLCEACGSSTVENPDAVDGGTVGTSVPGPNGETGNGIVYYDKDGDGEADCYCSTSSSGNCPDGDKICDCIASAKEELIAIKALLSGQKDAIVEKLDKLLGTDNATAEKTPPSNVSPWAPINPIASLPFEGMPVHSVLQASSQEKFGLNNAKEMQKRAHTVSLSMGVEGMPDFPVQFSTDPKEWIVLSDTMEQVRLFIRGFLLMVVYYCGFAQVWSILMRL